MKKIRKILIVFLLLLGSFLVTIGLLSINYSKSISNNTDNKQITIKIGSNTTQIGKLLKENNLIKNDLYFKIYCKILGKENLKAGIYNLNENMNIHEIVEILHKGNSINPDEITLTFKEGINMRGIAKIISENTINSYQSVIDINKDKEYLEYLINKYWFITEDILNENIYYSLEGYLYPDTYKFSSKNVEVKEIFNKLIEEMNNKLRNLKEEILKNKYTFHEILTIASIAELESSNINDRYNVTSVFYNRLKYNMSLGSDITTRYSLKIDDFKPLTVSQYNTINPYNTRHSSTMGKLPPSPISTVSIDTIKSSINPNNTDYLYFIANVKTRETFFYKKESDFLKKKEELSKINGGY